MLKVGELAALANLTVRTLHHYDDIGLLRPSARSDAGYRLYARDDVARLHRIQALRALGMRLADIGLALDSPAGSPLAVVDRQLAELERRIDDASRLRDQLLRVRGALASGAAPDMSTWLTTLEMTMERMSSTYANYFTQDELGRLPMTHDAAVQAEWRTLVEQASGLMQSQVAPDADAAKAFAVRWLDAFERGTAGDPELAARLNTMAIREQEAVGLPGPVMAYVFGAIAAVKYDIWARYLRPEVLARMRRHHASRGSEWPGLIERVHAQAKADPDGTSPASHALAAEWQALFHDMVGTGQADIEAFRHASRQEPLLRSGPGIGEAMLDWLRRVLRPQ